MEAEEYENLYKHGKDFINGINNINNLIKQVIFLIFLELSSEKKRIINGTLKFQDRNLFV